MTFRCNISCRHCYFEAGPDRKEEMGSHEAFSYIDKAKEIPTLRLLSLTGGEPFLLPELLFDTASYANDSGLETEVVTNCFWAIDKEKTQTTLSRLASSGVRYVNISADDFHQEFIPFSRVANCYEIAQQVGFRVTIQCAFAADSKLRLERIINLLGNENIAVLDRSPVGLNLRKTSAIGLESPFIPAGRGASVPEEQWFKGAGFPVRGCGHILRDIAIDPSGFVLPCCSAAGTVPSARLGNAREEPLKELIEEASHKETFNTLANQGPQALFSDKAENPSVKYTCICHMCHQALLMSEISRQQVFTRRAKELS